MPEVPRLSYIQEAQHDGFECACIHAYAVLPSNAIFSMSSEFEQIEFCELCISLRFPSESRS